MRIQAVALASVLAGAALLAIVPLGVQAAVPTIVAFDVELANGTSMPAAGFDLSAGDTVARFHATANHTGSTSPQAELLLRLQCGGVGCHTLRRLMTRAGDNWTYDLNSSSTDILVGVYDIEVQFNSGSEVAVRATGRVFNVTSSDTTAPTLTLSGGGSRANIGPGEVVRVSPTDALLWKVTYQITGLPTETLLTAPYALAGSSFAEGLNTLVFRAYDRAGHSTSLPVTVFRDTFAPNLSITAVNQTYLGIPIDVNVKATDASNTTLTLVGNGTQVVTVGPGANHTFRLTPAAIGNLTYTVRGVDPFGSASAQVRILEVFEPFTDIAISGLIATPDQILLGQDTIARATVLQLDGVIPVQVRITIGNATAHDVEVGLTNVANVQDTFRLPIGRHTINASIQLLSLIPELNGTNHNATDEVEVFLGRVVNGTDTYFIRTDERGFPKEAVGPGGETYALSLNESGSSVVYAFKVNGAPLYWDPLQQTTDLTPQASPTTPPTPPDDEKKAPGLPLAALLGALAVALMARRRKS